MTQHNPFPVPEEPGLLVPVGVAGWQNGYDAGISSPPGVPRTPLVRSLEYAQAWAQGAVAGNADGRTEGWRWAYFKGAVRPEPKDAANGHYGPQNSGEPGRTGSGAFARSWPAVGELPLQVMLAQFAEGDSDENGLTGRILARACADKGIPRLYLAVGLNSSGPVREATGDPLNDAGYWHGTVCESLEEAASEASAQMPPSRIPHFVALVRYAPAAEHHFFDLLPAADGFPPHRGGSG
ncbi:hypothetical protein J2Z21_009250 [Streptomyces griseochromogenes]|uniref:Uncharacterized protein n=1 Tax=Streptomyces griseochromogenes TaxID=68214 RepID=A0A1B1B114_9ACTN|nr:hypothetical protein [Streptomyces griseochromogenes]ANP52507.1 hypothetical protein AVL59_25860 [Streptomyces griseochromogenes]MBP2056232.1 hypothetical protein [Streptomyces griseochromogenes]